MKNAFAAFAVGFIFAIGLTLSGMTQPQKVVGFHDLFGSWDPSLMFVMAGAISVHFFTYRFIMKRARPLLDIQWHVPTKKDVTPSLVAGSVLFGIGWGLAGYCPGPALTSLATLEAQPFIFTVSMLIGMALFNQADQIIKFKK